MVEAIARLVELLMGDAAHCVGNGLVELEAVCHWTGSTREGSARNHPFMQIRGTRAQKQRRDPGCRRVENANGTHGRRTRGRSRPQRDDRSHATIGVMPTQQPYTHGHHDSVLRSHRWRTAQNSAAYLLPLLAPGMDLLDVGCGPGTLTADLAARVAPGCAVGVDLSSDVVAQARAHARGRGVANVSFRVGDFQTAGLAAASFDVVHAHQVLEHLEDPVGALEAMARLTRPGGIVAARDADYSAMTWAPADDRLDRWLAMIVEVTRRNGGEADAGRYLLGWGQQAHMRVVSYTTSTWTFATPEQRAWWADLWADRTVASAFAEQAVAYGVSTPQELAEVAQGWRSWAQRDDGVFVVVHGELITRTG